MNFDSELERYTAIANKAIADNLSHIDSSISSEAMRYSIEGGGKRLRPVMLLASVEAFGGSVCSALAFAAAIEMIHTYSLIHDDLPAMDDDDYRRGRLSCHKMFGEAYALLAGDALLNRAYESIFHSISECRDPALAKRLFEAGRIIADAAGINGMISGQTADILNENTDIDEKTLIYINERKTGALISASFKAGAIIGGADDKSTVAFAEAGMKTGIAFQIRDDVLDLEGSFEKLGKPIGSDEKNNKRTYATVLGKEQCVVRIRKLTCEAEALLESTGANAAFMTELIQKLVNRNK